MEPEPTHLASAVSYSSPKRLADACRKAGATLTVGVDGRFAPLFDCLDLLVSGTRLRDLLVRLA